MGQPFVGLFVRWREPHNQELVTSCTDRSG
jgi:hypothetical protein